MVDISKDFHQSFALLRHHKRIIVPVFLSVLIPLALIAAFLSLSGLSPLLRELSSASKEFDEMKMGYLTNTSNIGDGNYGRELANYLAQDSSDSDYNDEFQAYLEARG